MTKPCSSRDFPFSVGASVAVGFDAGSRQGSGRRYNGCEVVGTPIQVACCFNYLIVQCSIFLIVMVLYYCIVVS